MSVRDAASKRLVTINPDATLVDAARKMVSEGVSFLVVMEGDELYGVISEKDIVRALAQGVDPKVTKVREICKRHVITIREDEPLSTAARLMRENNIRHLVVVNSSGKPTGVLSVRDLLKEEKTLRKIEEMTIDQLQEWWFG